MFPFSQVYRDTEYWWKLGTGILCPVFMWGFGHFSKLYIGLKNTNLYFMETFYATCGVVGVLVQESSARLYREKAPPNGRMEY